MNCAPFWCSLPISLAGPAEPRPELGGSHGLARGGLGARPQGQGLEDDAKAWFRSLREAGGRVPMVGAVGLLPSGPMPGLAPMGPLGPLLGPDGRPLTQRAGPGVALGSGGSGSSWTSPGAYPCPQCRKVYRWRGNLNLHLRQECGKDPQFQCPMCPHRSKQKSNLKTHILNIHGPHVLRGATMTAERN